MAGAAAGWGQLRPFQPADLLEWREIVETRIRPDGSEVVYTERSADRDANVYRSRLWVVGTRGGAPRPLTTGEARERQPRWSPEGDRIAYLSDAGGTLRIHVRAAGAAPEAADTAIAPAAGTPLALAWSPDGRTLAYTARVREAASAAGWIPPALAPQLSAARTRLYLVAAAGGEPRQVALGELEPEGEPAWMPDGSGLVVALRAVADPAHPPQDPAIYLLALPGLAPRRLTQPGGSGFHPLPSPDGSRLAWLSRAGASASSVQPKLEAARRDGSRARPLAGALDREPEDPAWSSDSRTVYFVAKDRGQARVYAARNDGSVRTVLAADGLRAFSLADNGRAAAVRAPHELITFPVDVAGAPVVLAAPNRELLARRAAGRVEAIGYTAGGRTIQGWLTLPPGFDPTRRYPLLLDIDDAPRRMCGGGFRLRSQVLAGAGWIVLCANARGAPGYGEEFARLLRTGFPGDSFDDWMAGVSAAVTRPYVDGDRLAISGGLTAAWAIGHTARFHTAVARRPVADLTLEITTARNGARQAAWMGGMPWEIPEEYRVRSPISFAAQFRTPTLIVTGGRDPAADELAFALRARKVDSALVRVDARPRGRVLALEAEIGWLGR